MKPSCPREKLMYFSVFLGMQLTQPSTFEIACISKWLSYPRRLWKTTGMVVVLALSHSLRLQVLWAAPLNCPVMWQWSWTESPLGGLSHTWHMVAVLYACQSPRVILMALGLASTPLILSSSFWSACRKCSAAFGPCIRLAFLSGHHSAPWWSSNCKPHAAVSSECCSLWGQAGVAQMWW